ALRVLIPYWPSPVRVATVLCEPFSCQRPGGPSMPEGCTGARRPRCESAVWLAVLGPAESKGVKPPSSEPTHPRTSKTGPSTRDAQTSRQPLSRRSNQLHVIRLEHVVVAHQGKALEAGLRHEHPVEGIAVVPRQLR